MKAKVKCRIDSAQRDANNVVTLAISSRVGKVETTAVPAQWIGFSGTITIKAMIGDQIKIGDAIYLDIETKENEE